MNKEVEQRIVEMQFNNAEFETKVQQSLGTLQKLKEATKLEDAGKGLDNLASSANKLDLSAIAQGIEQLNARFSNLGIVGMTVMQNLTNAAMGLGKQLVNTLTEAPRGGMQTYESFITATKQLKNSAKDAEGLPVTLDAVNQALDQLNDYSDKTIYSFNDMTANIGKFTNAGVSLEDSVTAIKGISNVAASAGASAQNAASAMYNFGQALGTGVVKLIDWKSINNANMGTIEFKEQLIQTAKELGTLKEVGDRYIATTYSGKKANEEAFNASSKFEDSLQQQWMTSEVLIKTLGKYANEMDPIGAKAYQAATEVNSFTQMMSVFAESQKTSWSKTWRYIFGDYEESKQLWTGILNGLNWMTSGFNKWRNDFFQSWHDLGGRSELVSALSNIWTTITHYTELFGKAIGGIFTNIDASPLVEVAKGFNAFTEKIKPAVDTVEKVEEKVEETAEAVTEVTDRAEKFNEVVQEIIRGEWGNGQDRIDRLREAGYAFENLQNAVNELLGCEKRYETTVSDNEAVGISATEVLKENAQVLGEQKANTEAVTDAIRKENPVIGNLAAIVMGVTSSIKVVKAGLSAVWGTLAKGASILTVIKNALVFVLDIFGTIAGKVYSFNTWILSFSSITKLFANLEGRAVMLRNKLRNVGISLNNIVPLAKLLRSAVNKIKGTLDNFFNSLNSGVKALNFDKIKSVVFTIGKFVGGALLIALNAVAGLIVNIYKGLKSLYETVSSLTIVTRIVDHIKALKEELKGFVGTLKDTNLYTNVLLPILEEVSATMNRIGHAVAPILTDALNKVKAALTWVGDQAELAYQKLKGTGILDKATTVFENFKAALKDIPDLITAIYTALKEGRVPTLDELPESFKNLVTSFSELKTLVVSKVQEKFSKFLDDLSHIFEKLPNSKVLGPFSGFIQKLKDSFDKFKETTDGAGDTISAFITKVWNKLSKIDYRNTAITALIGTIALFVFRWSKVGKSASFALKSIGKFILNGGKIAQTAADKYTGFLKIAGAIGIIAGSIWLLAQVPADAFARSVGVIAGAFTLMFGAIEVLTIQKIPADNMKAMGIAFAGMGAAMLMMAGAAKILATMEWDELGKAAVALVGFTFMIVKAAKAAEKVGVGAGAAFLGLSLALFILIPSIEKFAKMDVGTLVKGGVAVYAFTQIMAKAAAKAGESKGAFGAFMGMSLALLILIPSIKMLADMDIGVLIKGGVAIYAFLMMMSKAAREAGEGTKGFLGMGIAIGIIAVSLKLLSTLSWAQLLASSAALKRVLSTMAEALKTISEIPFSSILKSVFALVAVLAAVGGALYLLTKYTDTDKTLKAALGIAAIMFAFSQMGPAITALSKIPFAAGVQAAGNAVVFFGAMALCLGALGALDELTNGATGDAMANGALVLGQTIHNFLWGLVTGTDTTDALALVTKIAETLTGFGEKIQGFLNALINTDITVVDKAKSLAMAILAICGAELLEAITSWITGEADVTTFAEMLGPLTDAIISMNEKLAGVTLDATKMEQVASVVSSFSDLAKTIPRSGGLAQKILGVQDLSSFADEMAAFVLGGFRKFARYVNGLGDTIGFSFVTKTLQIASATQAMADLANNIPRSGGWADAILGVKDLSDFAGEMKSFIKDGFREFATEVNGMTDISLDKLRANIIPATDEMLTLASKLTGQGNVITNFLTGKQDLSQFGSKLAGFGKGMKDFADNIRGISFTHIDGLTASAERLAALNASENLQGSSLGAFSECIRTLGAAIAQFNTDTGATDPETFSAAIDKITSLHNLMLILSGTDYSGISNFSEALAELGSSSATSFIEAFSESSARASEAAKEFIVSVTEGIDSMKSEFSKKGQLSVIEYVAGISKQGRNVLYVYGAAIVGRILAGIASMFDEINKKGAASVLEFCVGINSQDGILKGAGKHIVSKAIDGAKEDIDDFYDLGDDAISGFAQGIKDNAYKAANAARKGVRDALDAGADEQKSASPAKEFAKLGKYGIEGYALGFTKNIGLATSAVRKTAKAGIFAMQEAIANTQNMVSDSIDFNPTITPVMDLTLLEQGLQQTTGLLSGLERVNTDVQAAIDIADAYNAALARSHNTTPTNYTNQFSALLDSNAKLIEAVKRNRYALIDGEQVFNYVDRRFGEA